jgi:hypothetical protein
VKVNLSFAEWLVELDLKAKLLGLIVCVCAILIGHPAAGYSPERAGFSVKFKDEISPYRVMGVFVLPGELLTLEAQDPLKKHQYEFRSSAGETNQIASNKWRWQAPGKTGLYPLKIIHVPSRDSVILNVFVMIPRDKSNEEYLNGYRIGKYPTIPFRQLPVYKPPKGFIEVTKENQETLVSPHFKLKQFLCKQAGNYPKYLVLRERLLLKLELILEKANEKGYGCETFSVLSGYRTPYYNKMVKSVQYSRHIYGGAADIFIDENPKDGMMDDLNLDGKIDYQDAGVLYDMIEAMRSKPWYSLFIGGLGKYRRTTSHGPFVHVDERGFRARW